ECCLLHMQVDRLEQACVSGHQISRDQTNDIPRNQLAPWDLAKVAIAQHRSRKSDSCSQPLHRVLRAVGLHEVESNAEHHDHNDDASIDYLTEKSRNDACHEQDEDEGIGKQKEQLPDPCNRFSLAQFIRTDLTQSATRLLAGQAPIRGVKLLEEL